VIGVYVFESAAVHLQLEVQQLAVDADLLLLLAAEPALLEVVALHVLLGVGQGLQVLGHNNYYLSLVSLITV